VDSYSQRGAAPWRTIEDRYNVTFRDAAPVGGSVPDTDAGTSVTRSFPRADSYDYDCTQHTGMSGRVVVR
jgi:plastocyanin